MSIFGKLAFWKKHDEFKDIGLGDKGMGSGFGGNDINFNQGLDNMGMPDTGYGMPTQETASAPMMEQPQQSFQRQSFQQQPRYQPPSFQQQESQNYAAGKDFEIISSKLDALRAAIDSINQRLANLEAIARGEQEDNRRRYRY